MSESEKYEAQGRAYAALRQARANAATLQSRLDSYVKEWTQATAALSHIVANPLALDEDGKLVWPAMRLSIGVLQSPSTVVQLIEELVTESRNVQRLQAQVDKF